MDKIVKLIMNCLNSHIIISAEDAEIYEYGIDIVAYTVLSTLGLIVVGALFRMTLQSTIIIGVYYVNQTIGGGFHADTHLKCFLSMLIFLILDLLILSVPVSQPLIAFMGLASSGVLFLCPIVIHPNKKYLVFPANSPNHNKDNR